jgi:hypothetical protein
MSGEDFSVPDGVNGDDRDRYHYDDEYYDDYDEDDDYGDPAEVGGDIGQPAKVVSRRLFLGAAGMGAGAAAFAAGAPPVAARMRNRRRNRRRPRRSVPPRTVDDGPDRFGRIFDRLPPFAEPSEELNEALIELSRPGGILDANDPIEVGPIRLITEPDLSPNNLDNPTQTAGTTFVGQFLDHDITRDAGSTLGRPLNLRRSTNLRTPRFDLDSVYGGGPTESPELYSGANPIRFLVESGGLFEDLPRDANNTAIIADPRNDENMMISGLQVALLKFHNAVAERVEASGLSGMNAFEETRRLVRWHWQWTIVNEFLPQIVGDSILQEMVANGPRFRPRRLQIPVEFQGAAYRFGHSMVRPSYRANLAGDNGQPFFAMVFDVDKLQGPDPETLLGGYRAPRRFIGWQTFFDFGDGEVKPNKRIDTSISTPLFRLPTFTIDSARGDDVGPTSLATRNLLRHVTWELPSGQAVAAEMGVEQLGAPDLADLEPFGADLAVSTPLWFYVLREAELMEDGLRLGPIGGRIVAEVFTAILGNDSTSYVGAEPGWRPTLPSAAGAGVFRMTDLLTIAGVDPASRGQ